MWLCKTSAPPPLPLRPSATCAGGGLPGKGGAGPGGSFLALPPLVPGAVAAEGGGGGGEGEGAAAGCALITSVIAACDKSEREGAGRAPALARAAPAPGEREKL